MPSCFLMSEILLLGKASDSIKESSLALDFMRSWLSLLCCITKRIIIFIWFSMFGEIEKHIIVFDPESLPYEIEFRKSQNLIQIFQLIYLKFSVLWGWHRRISTGSWSPSSTHPVSSLIADWFFDTFWGRIILPLARAKRVSDGRRHATVRPV